MRLLTATTEDAVVSARTALAEDAAKGTTVAIVLENIEGVTDGCALCVGRPGSETAELVRATVTSGAVTATLKMDHAAGEQVSVFRFDSRRFYAAATEGGAYSLVATLAIKVDDPQGTTYEYDGAAAWFKATYYDSVTGGETLTADAEAAQGDQSSRYASLDSIRRKAGMSRNAYLQDDRFEAARGAAEGECDASIGMRYALPLATVPALVTQICEMLAAGSVMTDEFGSADGNEGPSMMRMARSMLKDIREGKTLLTVAGVETAAAETGRPSFYPNAASAASTTDPTGARMTRNRKY